MPNFLDAIFGRMGNRMFQMAALYKYAKMNETDIYFQDPKWFKGCEGEIKEMFGQGISYDDRIAIHVRRGDYVNNPFYVDLLGTGYYSKAMEQFPDSRFLIFSDDIEFCKERFGHFSFVDFSENKTEEEDLKLMAGCRGIIMANSSFSWWASFLNPNPNKIIIAPIAWYSDGQERTVCPEEWIRL